MRRFLHRARLRFLVGLIAWFALLVPAAGASIPGLAADPSGSPDAAASTAHASPAASPASSSAPVALESVEDPLFLLQAVAPEGWQPVGSGLRARGAFTADPVLLALQSAPGGADALWPSLLPQLRLTEVPAPAGTRTTPALEWTLWSIEASVPTGDLVIDLAMAERDGRTFLVLLQSTAADAPALRGSVFLPAVDALRPLVPEPTLDPASLPYESEDVTFPGGAAGVTLAGTLTRPATPDPVPAVVLMTGSGPQDRDESLAPVSAIKPFALIADALTRAGIAVLRYDDRGVGASTGDYPSATIADLVSDGRAAIDFLASRPDIDAGRIGLLGHSEGGIYAASLAATDPRVAFVVGLAPPAVSGVDLIVAQSEAIARASGLPADEVEATRRSAERVFPAALQLDEPALRALLEEEAGATWDRQSPEARTALGERDAFIEQQVAIQLPQLTSEWFRSFLASDPGADWARVTVPVLGIFGGRDVQVVASQNEPALREALADAGNDASRTRILPFANHLFQSAVSGAPGEYGSLPPEFTPELLPLLVGWVAEQAGVGTAPEG